MHGTDSGAWEPYYRARAMKEAGIPVCDLTVGDHDIPTDPSILAEMTRSARGGKTRYTAIAGITPLRQAVANRIEQRTGIPTGVENVMITNGGQGALIASHLALLNPGDRALFFDPYYPTYPGTIMAAGGIPVPVATDPRNEFRPDPAALKAAASGARSLLFNSPNNPTGTVYPRETIRLLGDTAMEHDLWVISDEVYDTQIWSGQHHSIRALPGMEERSLVIGSMSKAYAMTGSRVGWLAGPAKIMEALDTLLTVVTFGVPEYIQEAALFALEQGSPFEEWISSPFRQRVQVALARLEGQQAVVAVPPRGAMYLMLNIGATGMSGKEFAMHLLETEQVAVMPGESFGSRSAGHVRVALTVPAEELGDAIGRLATLAGRLAADRAPEAG